MQTHNYGEQTEGLIESNASLPPQGVCIHCVIYSADCRRGHWGHNEDPAEPQRGDEVHETVVFHGALSVCLFTL